MRIHVIDLIHTLGEQYHDALWGLGYQRGLHEFTGSEDVNIARAEARVDALNEVINALPEDVREGVAERVRGTLEKAAAAGRDLGAKLASFA